MKIIAGLGNPGEEYSQTRHNVGFMMLDALAAHWKTAPWRNKFSALIAEIQIGEEKVLLVKPQTYMNLSGEAVGQIIRWHKCAAADVIAVYDDMDIPVGTARLRICGSSGGHRGVESLLMHLGTEDFPRVRIGIGRPKAGWTVVNHVLSKIPDADQEKIQDIIDRLRPALEYSVQQGFEKAMSRYNSNLKEAKKTAQEEKP